MRYIVFREICIKKKDVSSKAEEIGRKMNIQKRSVRRVTKKTNNRAAVLHYTCKHFFCVISGFRCEEELRENCALLRYYAASSDNSLRMFRDNLSVLSPRAKRWGRKFVPKRLWGIINTRCVITQKSAVFTYIFVNTQFNKILPSIFNPYPTAFPYGNGMVLHFYQQQESSTTKTVHKVINKGLKTYV